MDQEVAWFQLFEKIEGPKRCFIHDYCEKMGFYRLMPSKEAHACYIIRMFVRGMLPDGGMSLLIGTPSPFSIAKAYSKSKSALSDNLRVANALAETSDKFRIVIGNAVNKLKALAKAEIFRAFDSTHKANVRTGPVNGLSYAYWVNKLARENSLCKVVLLTSGLWAGCEKSRRAYGFDVDFKTPSKKLTKKYSGLHILAMVNIANRKFEVRYLHNGTDRVVTKEEIENDRART